MKRILDHIFLMRPLLLFPIWSPFLFGYYRSGGTWGNHLILPMIMLTALGGGGYVLNQIFDLESDKINRKLFILPKGYISLKAAWIQTILLDITAISIGFILEPEVGFAVTIGVLAGKYPAGPHG